MRNRKVQCWIFAVGQWNPSDPKSLDSIQCLLLKTNVTRGSYWQPVTGTVESHEGYYEAACREPFEETGFNFESAPQDIGYEFEFTSQYGVTKERVFILKIEKTENPKIDPKEHQDFQWTTPQNALTLLKYPTNIEGLKRSYRFAFGKDLAV